MTSIKEMGRNDRSEIWKKDKKVLTGTRTKGTGMVTKTRITKITGMEMRKVEGAGIIGMIRTEMMIGRVLELDALSVVVITLLLNAHNGLTGRKFHHNITFMLQLIIGKKTFKLHLIC